MGLFDALVAKKEANVAKLKVAKAEADAKIANLNAMHSLAEEIQNRIQGTPDQMGFDQNAPDVSEVPNQNAMFAPPVKQAVNPSLIPNVIPGTPGQSLGDPLLDKLVPLILKSGDLGAATKVAEFVGDPKRQMMRDLTGNINMRPGGQPTQGQPSTTPDMLSQIIESSSKGDSGALSKAAQLKTLGIDTAPFIERMQRANEPIKRNIHDPETGHTYEALYTRQGAEEIPGTRNLVKKEDVQWVEMAIPGGGTEKVPFRGTQKVEMGRPATPQLKLGSSNLKPVDISLPQGSTQEDIDRILQGVSKVGQGGIVTKYPESQTEIPSADLPLWVNPNTLQEVNPGMTPVQAKQEGFARLSTQSKQNVDSLKAAVAVVGEVKRLMGDVFPSTETSPLALGRLSRPMGALLQTNPKASVLFNLVNGTLAPVVRSMGEKGNLSDNDMKRAQGLMLKSTDSATVARETTNELLRMLGIIQKSVFVGGYKNLPTNEKNVNPKTTNKIGRFEVEVIQ